jgi:hypothetical protein
VSRPPSATSVFCARLTRGTRKVGTALAMASTPVRAEQPEAKALARFAHQPRRLPPTSPQSAKAPCSPER